MNRFVAILSASWIFFGSALAAQNLLLNSSFDSNLEGWRFETLNSTIEAAWHPSSSPASSAPSGSALLADDQQPPPVNSTITGELTQCVSSIEPGYFRLAGWIWWNELALAGRASTAEVLYYSAPDCGGTVVASHDLFFSEALRADSWMYGERIFRAENAHSALVRLRLDYLWSVEGSLQARFDDIRFEPIEEPEGAGFTDPDFPLFRFKVRILPPGRPAADVKVTADCVADAICFSGAVPGRAEVIIRLTGVRPNRYIWATVQRLTTSRVEVWVTDHLGTTRTYVLDPLDPDDPRLIGLTDRYAFFRGV